MVTPEILFTDDQRIEIIQILQNISDYEMIKYYIFSSYDIDIIKNIEEVIEKSLIKCIFPLAWEHKCRRDFSAYNKRRCFICRSECNSR